MDINPSPIKRAFVCPLCGEAIDAMEPHETAKAPSPEGWEPNLSLHPAQNQINFAIAQNMAANEALIWAHFESHHTLKEAVLALGVARNALMEIQSMAKAANDGGAPMTNFDYAHLAARGLAGK